jgi:ABC-type glycerol-3-phosphate transport system substrate-binding protein
MDRRKFVFTSAAVASVPLIGSASAAPSHSAQRRYGFMQDDQVLRISLNGAQVGENDQKLADGFAEVVPGARIEFIPLQGSDWNDYFSKLLTMVASGDPPDLTTVATEGTQLFAGRGLGEPLDDYVNQDVETLQEYFSDVHPSLVESMMYEGNLYQLPFDWNAANMYFNLNALAEKGLEMPGPNWTKDEFYDMAKALTAEGGGPPFGYAWTNRLWGGWMPWIFVNDSNLLTEERAPGGEWLWDTFYKDDPAAEGRGGGWRWESPKANDPANVEALEFMIQLAEERITPSAEEGGGDLLQGFFTSGDVAMTPAGGFWAGGLNSAGLNPDEFDVQFFPKWKSQRHQFGAAGLVMMKEARNKDLAWEYMKYYVSKPTMELFYETNPTTPTRRSMLTEEQYSTTGPKNWNAFYATLDEFPDSAPIPAPPESNEMTSIFMRHTSEAINFQVDAKTALDNMQAELEELFGAS